MDWRVGDLAVCIKTDAWVISPWSEEDGDAPAPSYGEYVTVGDLSPEPDGLYLAFDEYPAEAGYFKATRFRKLDRHEPCTADFSVLVKRKAPSPEERHERIMGALFGASSGSRPSDGATLRCLHHSASIRSAGGARGKC